jgi:hypothetical protein
MGSGLEGGTSAGCLDEEFSFGGSILRVLSGDLDVCCDLAGAAEKSGGASVDCIRARGEFPKIIDTSSPAVPNLGGALGRADCSGTLWRRCRLGVGE